MRKVTRLLIQAASTGNVPLATRIIDQHGLSYEPEWLHGYKFLRIAVKLNNTAFVKFLLSRGCPVRENAKTTCHSEKKQEEIFNYNILFYAIKNENIKITRLLMDKGADINGSNNIGMTPITYAVTKNNKEIVELLLDRGADINCRVKDYPAPLHIACTKNFKDIVWLLLRKGADANVRTTRDETPLHLAARYAHYNVMTSLLGYRVTRNINARTTYDETPMHFAVQYGNRSVVNLLGYRGANIDHQDKMGRTPLYFAIARGSLLAVEDVLKFNPNLTYESNQTCLNLALSSDGTVFEKIVDALLTYGFTVTQESAKDPKVLLGAVEKEKLKVVQDLLKYGADVNVRNECGRTPLHFCVIYENEDTVSSDDDSDDESDHESDDYTDDDNPVKEDSPVNLEMAQLLLDKGANIDAQTDFGATALYAAILKGSHSMVNFLLRNNPNVNLATVKGGSALRASIMVNNKELCTELLSRGADVNAKSENGDTALHDAVLDKNTELVKLLLENGARVNSKGEDGRTPLHLADKSEIVDALWTFGANVDAKDDDGKTALHLSAEEGDTHTLRTLLEYGADLDVKCKLSKTAFDCAQLKMLFSFGDYSCKDAVDFLHLYISVLSIAGLSGSKPHFITPAGKKLELELERMKSEIIENTNVSYHDVLKKSTKILARYMKNERVVQAFKTEEYMGKFPLYGGILTGNFRRGLVRIRLLEAAGRFFQRLSNLPQDCVERIVDFLSEDDLWVLVDV